MQGQGWWCWGHRLDGSFPPHSSLALSELQIHPSCQGVGGSPVLFPPAPQVWWRVIRGEVRVLYKELTKICALMLADPREENLSSDRAHGMFPGR